MPVIEEITPGAFSVASSQRGAGVAAGQLRLPIGHDECLSPAAELAARAKRPAWAPHDPEVTVNSTNYTPIGTDLRPPSALTAGLMAWERKRRGPTAANGHLPDAAVPAGVRPFRSLISAQAIYRREVFQ